jgi:CRISPR-associated protein Csm4
MQIQSWSILGRSFHFGLHGLGQEKTSPTFPSDSLFAALVSRLARSADSDVVDAFCQPFMAGQPPFVLTSTFPLAGGVRFFPPPLTSRKPPEKLAAGKDAKTFKRVAYVSEKLFCQLLNGAMLSELTGTRSLQGEQLWLSAEEFEHLPSKLQKEDAKVWAEEQRPRVTLDRASQASTLFFTGQVTFAEGCGLWFGIRWLKDDSTLQKRVADLLADLSEAGLGAERNSGLGAAKIDRLGEFELPDPAAKWTTLSRYLPRETEISAITHPDSAYTLKSVGGWLDSAAKPGQRRKMVNLLVEGSVFGALPSPVPGQVADARPIYGKEKLDPLGHPVYRSGLALAIGMGAKAGDA